jgi:undecaprenyl-diphosphatase
MIEAILLGIVQGLTEWLPVSSSGHLVIVQELLGVSVPLGFDVALHTGTIIAVIVFFWNDIKSLSYAALKLDFKSKNGRIIPYIIYGTLPIAVVGILFRDLIAGMFTDLTVVGAALLTTGAFLYLTKYSKSTKNLSGKSSFIVGLSQAVALVPGISRSGFTISTGRILGIDRETVFRFSFLLAIPAVIGATVLEVGSADFSSVGIAHTLVGTAIAAIVGYLSLKFLHRMLRKGRLHAFAYYCWAIAVVILAISLA